MKLDENEFFRQVTLRMCGSLDIATALWQCFLYLEYIFPLDRIHLHLYQKGLGAVRTLATANESGGKTMDLVTSMSDEARANLEGTEPPFVRIVNEPELDPVSRKLVQVFGDPESSRLIMRLNIEGKRMGAVALVADGRNRYSNEHARLFSLLNEPFAIAMSNTLRHQELLKLKEMLADDNLYLHQELLRLSGDQIVGKDLGLRKVTEMVRQVAPLNSPVLLLGETGVGKDVIANAIHNLSQRREGPFIKVDCGAIPETLIDSELFGHEKGAFTGAIAQKRGRFERAHEGTLFLDEIGELPPQAQIRMLRLIQNREIERVGSTRFISVDIRIIAATHRNLEQMVKNSQFREDLWFRLNVFPIRIPPLRERAEDIPALVNFFIEKKSKELRLSSPPDLSVGAIERLTDYSWPGNVRELENVIERALIMNRNSPLVFNSFILPPSVENAPSIPQPEVDILNLDQIHKRHIKRVLVLSKGKVHGPGGAAEMLGINPSTLRNRMNKLGIPYGRKTNT
jgi:transcriptional regulator with GAF, ATPase, and Fis domain